MASLLQLVTASKILCGTDFPPSGTSQEVARTLAEVGMFNQAAGV